VAIADPERVGDPRRSRPSRRSLDVLVNNAGGYSSPTYPANDGWRSTLELNLLSVMEAIKHALPLAVLPGCVVMSPHPQRVFLAVCGITTPGTRLSQRQAGGVA
jgi:NAD(P)-dependent dehydrogenase (short-subunit alcohol dehydrogenase family)